MYMVIPNTYLRSAILKYRIDLTYLLYEVK